MKKILLPILLAILGTSGGAGAGFFLRPPPEVPDVSLTETSETFEADEIEETEPEPTDVEYAKLNNQFVVPVVHDGRMQSLVIMTLSLEVTTGGKTSIFEVEPKLRDAFFTALIEHANIGGFDGNFTNSANMRSLREALFDASQEVVGSIVQDVLILDIARQDV